MQTLTIARQTCHLLPERAVLWEEQNTLILADIHLGKSATFRKAGIPVPEGSMEHDLLALGNLIERFQPKRCIVVGDLIHAKSGLAKNVLEMFSIWLAKVDCELDLVIGNHDRALAKNLPQEWPIRLFSESAIEPPFCFTHIPMKVSGYFVWSGHLHPQVVIGNRHDSLKLRCFQIYKDLAILPAFGSFVGGTVVDKSNDCSIYVIADSKIISI